MSSKTKRCCQKHHRGGNTGVNPPSVLITPETLPQIKIPTNPTQTQKEQSQSQKHSGPERSQNLYPDMKPLKTQNHEGEISTTKVTHTPFTATVQIVPTLPRGDISPHVLLTQDDVETKFYDTVKDHDFSRLLQSVEFQPNAQKVVKVRALLIVRRNCKESIMFLLAEWTNATNNAPIMDGYIIIPMKVQLPYGILKESVSNLRSSLYVNAIDLNVDDAFLVVGKIVQDADALHFHNTVKTWLMDLRAPSAAINTPEPSIESCRFHIKNCNGENVPYMVLLTRKEVHELQYQIKERAELCPLPNPNGAKSQNVNNSKAHSSLGMPVKLDNPFTFKFHKQESDQTIPNEGDVLGGTITFSQAEVGYMCELSLVKYSDGSHQSNEEINPMPITTNVIPYTEQMPEAFKTVYEQISKLSTNADGVEVDADKDGNQGNMNLTWSTINTKWVIPAFESESESENHTKIDTFYNKIINLKTHLDNNIPKGTPHIGKFASFLMLRSMSNIQRIQLRQWVMSLPGDSLSSVKSKFDKYGITMMLPVRDNNNIQLVKNWEFGFPISVYETINTSKLQNHNLASMSTGGKGGNRDRVIYNKRKYKVYTSKRNKHRYIVVKGHRMYLKDIRGKYKKDHGLKSTKKKKMNKKSS